ncbi:DUF4337 domain-containing protein [Arenibacter algicola]|uniref:DUF4337 domain-containing protein n=1 Tax=Arenibacter algicola TaxID=616991 RepID=A0A221V3E9_9FLAO|nr:DUF4337 domain-containing protein [Arenibacter algicola]ASO08109.1 hypothetical protein AREALGSMS7_04720 [Arenibacter algicola]MDX1758509.1 DUF4337 domain-containing protein [Arenibacter algicola]
MSTIKSEQTSTTTPRTLQRTETIGGILIAVFAALLAIAELVNNNLEEEMMISHSQFVNYSNWYQSKSIKQSLKESELDYLNALTETGIIPEDKIKNINAKIAQTKGMVLKYEAEKTEILVGSSNVPREHWAQDLDGEMGKIIGINEWEKLTQDYETATKKFDLGKLMFQICIVLGAVCIIIRDNKKLQKNFIILMLAFGAIGILISAYGFILAP